ncbi:hypothetical protein [Asticcacaulis solisilvae]|uniref:hypothetical protein n=1 Tax=Asticcacaulis solisilvae TaxID=1217274 RepID=UPI003FD8EA90
MSMPYRMNVFVDDDRKVMVLRVIGPMPGFEYAERLFEAYDTVPDAWNYARLMDFRRFEGELGFKEIDAIADRWKAMTDGIDYHGKVAVVSTDPLDAVRVPAVSPQFPKETVCHFSDFHEAMDWLTAGGGEAQALAG